MKKITFTVLALMLLGIISYSFVAWDDAEVDKKVELEERYSLAGVINNYRASKGLPKIKVSPSLTKVAKLHVKDLAENRPDTGACNIHSWSDKGKWTPCCYTSDHAKASCIWDKPRELTEYRGDGYEITAWSMGKITPEYALSMWKTSPGHHNLIINEGIWKRKKWRAIGAAIYKGYAVVWFGAEVDPVRR